MFNNNTMFTIIFVFLLAVFYPFLSHIAKVGNVFKASTPYETSDCTQVKGSL